MEPIEVLLHPDLEQLLHNLTSRLTILTPVPPKIQSSPSPRIILFRQPQESSLAVIVLKVAGPEHPMNCKDILEAILSVLPREGCNDCTPFSSSMFSQNGETKKTISGTIKLFSATLFETEASEKTKTNNSQSGGYQECYDKRYWSCAGN